MKETYSKVDIEVVSFDTEDVIVCSCGVETDPVCDTNGQ